MGKLLLGLFFPLIICSVGQKISIEDEPIQLLNVDVKMPWYIEFSFPCIDGLQPLSFDVDFYSGGVRTPIEFFIESNNRQWVLRNRQPQSFKTRDFIAGKLEFTASSGQVRWIPVFYKITRNRRFDAIVITESKEKIQMASATLKTTTLAYSTTTESHQQFQDFQNSEVDCSQKHKIKHISEGSAAETLVSAVFDKITNIQQEVLDLKGLVQTALQYDRIGTRLILTGLTLPASSTPLEEVRKFITDKLQLKDLGSSVLLAELVCNAILFEISLPQDKARILTNAAMSLEKSPYTIRDVIDGNFTCPPTETITNIHPKAS